MSRLSELLRQAREEQETNIRTTLMILQGKIPCTPDTCWNWKAGLCGNRNNGLATRRPPKVCDCDIRLFNHLYPVENENKKKRGGRRYAS